MVRNFSTTPLKTEVKPALTWAKAIMPPAAEFDPTPLPTLAGTLPAGLRGSLYRNGPGRLERGGQRMGHWFDGDGAILAVHFNQKGREGTATGLYRYVKTTGYQDEEAAGKLLYGGYGMTASGSIWRRLTKAVKNAANTSVLALPDKLLALWEGGHPHQLDLQTLETVGLDDLGALKNTWHYSAHPKRDVQTGEIYNFGVSPGKNAILQVYRSNRAGKVVQHNSITLDGVPLVHDFVLAGNYLVFFIPPVRLNPLPVLFQQKSYSDALAWHPEKATQILVIDRNTLEVVSRSEAEPWYQWHFGNGYVDAGGSVVVDLARYQDFQTNQRLQQVAAGHIETTAKATLWQIRLDPQTAKITQMQEVVDRSCEFPTVAPAEIGHASRFTYLSLHRQGVDIGPEIYGAIARFDYHTGTLTEADLGDNRYPTEPIYCADADHPDRGWIVTVVFDGERNSSEVWIFDADQLDAPPVCRLALPSVVPMGFHGTWNPA